MKKMVCMLLSIVLCVMTLFSGTIFAFAASTEYVKTDKAEYKSGEMVKISYSLDTAESSRFICVYKDEAIYNNLMYAMSASSISNDGVWVPSSNVVWTWHGGGPSIMTKPLSAGTYIVKVMYLTGVSTNAPDYVEGAKSSIMSTFTVVENTGSADPTISATKTELEAGENIEITFDGVTNKLGSNTLSIELKNSAGTVVKTWDLWDGSTEYAGLNGKVSYTGDLSADTYTATLVCSDAEITLGDAQIQFVVKAQANTPTGAASIGMISVLLMFGTVAYFVMKKRCTR